VQAGATCTALPLFFMMPEVQSELFRTYVQVV
jgi:hypothetical protein